MRRILPSFALFAALAAFADGASGRVLHVGVDKEYKKPSAAISAAQAGDTIVIDAGVWTNDTIRCPGTPNLKIRGAGIDKTVLDAISFNARRYGDPARPHIADWKGIWVITGIGWTIGKKGQTLL